MKRRTERYFSSTSAIFFSMTSFQSGPPLLGQVDLDHVLLFGRMAAQVLEGDPMRIPGVATGTFILSSPRSAAARDWRYFSGAIRFRGL